MCIDGIPLNVVSHPVKRPVSLYRIGSKSVLINSSFTRRTVVFAQPDGMSGGQPMEGLADLFAGFAFE